MSEEQADALIDELHELNKTLSRLSQVAKSVMIFQLRRKNEPFNL